MFSLRTLKAFARAPIIPPPPPYVIVPMVTFRTSAPQALPAEDKETSKSTEQTFAGAPSTDDIAHSDAAYDGSHANPKESAQKIEREKSGSMGASAANPKASKPATGKNSETDMPSPSKESR